MAFSFHYATPPLRLMPPLMPRYFTPLHYFHILIRQLFFRDSFFVLIFRLRHALLFCRYAISLLISRHIAIFDFHIILDYLMIIDITPFRHFRSRFAM